MYKTIYPKCKLRHDQAPALRYDGYLVPCCHFADQSFQELRELLGNKIEQIKIAPGITVEDINCSEAYWEIEQTFSKQPLKTCQYKCGIKNLDSETTTIAGSEKFVKRKL